MSTFFTRALFLALGLMNAGMAFAQNQPSTITGENGVGGRGGGDNVSSGYAWFHDRKNISYCIERDSGFPFSEKQLAEKIDSAFKAWEDYFELKKVSKDSFSFSPQVIPKRINITYVKGGNCTFDKFDLIFYFGTETKLTEKYRKLYFDPAAFSHPGYFDAQSKNKKGLVWFSMPKKYTILNLEKLTAPRAYPLKSSKDCRQVEITWKESNIMNTMLRHEMSHILGNPYVEGTIADEFIFRNILLKKWQARNACLCIQGLETEKQRSKFIRGAGSQSLFACSAWHKRGDDHGFLGRQLDVLLPIDQKRELYFHTQWLSYESKFIGKSTYLLKKVTGIRFSERIVGVKISPRPYDEDIDTKEIKNTKFNWDFSWLDFIDAKGKSSIKLPIRVPIAFGDKNPIHSNKIVFNKGDGSTPLLHSSFNRHAIASVIDKNKVRRDLTLIITRSKGFESSIGIFYLDDSRRVKALFRGTPSAL